MVGFSSWASTLVSPQVMWSQRASWMNMYWSCNSECKCQVKAGSQNTKQYTPHNTACVQLTKVCTICFLLVLISLTNSKMLRSPLCFSLSIIASRVMKMPVRLTPALRISSNHEWSLHAIHHHPNQARNTGSLSANALSTYHHTTITLHLPYLIEIV